MSMPRWTFLSNHTHVLVCLARDPGMTMREVAEQVGVTERAVQRIVADLESGGYLVRRRRGRRNEYVLHPDLPLRHPLEERTRLSDLLDVLEGSPGAPRDVLP